MRAAAITGGEAMTSFKHECERDDAKGAVAQLLDDNDCDNVFLYDEYGKRVEFEQVALIPREDDDGEITVYCILKPVERMPGVGDDEALVFSLQEIDDEDAVILVDDDDMVDSIFAEYYDLLKCEKDGAE